MSSGISAPTSHSRMSSVGGGRDFADHAPPDESPAVPRPFWFYQRGTRPSAGGRIRLQLRSVDEARRRVAQEKARATVVKTAVRQVTPLPTRHVFPIVIFPLSLISFSPCQGSVGRGNPELRRRSPDRNLSDLHVDQIASRRPGRSGQTPGRRRPLVFRRAGE